MHLNIIFKLGESKISVTDSIPEENEKQQDEVDGPGNEKDLLSLDDLLGNDEADGDNANKDGGDDLLDDLTNYGYNYEEDGDDVVDERSDDIGNDESNRQRSDSTKQLIVVNDNIV